MKKFYKVLLIVVVIATFIAVVILATSLAGCGRKTGIKVPDQTIPFLTLVPGTVNGKNIKKAFLNFWDLKNGKIIKTDKVIYTVTPTADIKSEQAVYESYNDDRPLYWDGKDCIILPWFFKVETSLYKRTETIAKLTKPHTNYPYGGRIIFGRDVEMIKVESANKSASEYIVKIRSGNRYAQKELNLNFPYKNSTFFRPVAIGNGEANLNILVSGGYNPKTGMDLFLCTIDKKNWTIKWHKISVENDADVGPSNPPNSSNSIYLDGSFYLQGYCIIANKVNTKELVCSKWDVVIPSKFTPDTEGAIVRDYTSIAGSFNDMIIIRDASGKESYICLFDKNGKVLGAMHLINGNVEIMDRNGNVLSSTTFDKNSSLIFPRMNGGI